MRVPPSRSIHAADWHGMHAAPLRRERRTIAMVPGRHPWAELVDRGPVAGTMFLRPEAWRCGAFARTARGTHSCKRRAQCLLPSADPQSFLSREAQHVEALQSVLWSRTTDCDAQTRTRFNSSRTTVEIPKRPRCRHWNPTRGSAGRAAGRAPHERTMIWRMRAGSARAQTRAAAQAQSVGQCRAVGAAHAPILRSSEFLWQEGHAHASAECALGTAREMQGVYADFCRDVLAVPVVKGEKARERFAGAEQT